jgi:glycosyltransferase involved in cell wall biosynthesis
MSWLRREKENQRRKQRIKPRSEAPIRVIHQPVRSIEFDLTNLRPHHNGTAEVACKIAKKFKERFGAEFEVRLHAPESVLRFHELEFSNPSEGTPDCCLRFGQIHTPKELLLFMQRAPLLGAVFLDTIALDCMHLDEVNFWKLWHSSFMSLDFALFISEFGRHQALLRFPDSVPETSVAQLLSTSTVEYCHSSPKEITGSDYFFVVGNRFAHKDVHYITEEIARLANKKVIALADRGEQFGNISYIRSGSISYHEMQELYANASVVIFPSHYEGFGFPIMHALANRRPIICRDLPVYREIIEKTAEGINVYPCRSRNDLIRLAVEKTPVWLEPTEKILPVTWLDFAETLAQTIRRASAHRRDAQKN